MIDVFFSTSSQFFHTQFLKIEISTLAHHKACNVRTLPSFYNGQMDAGLFSVFPLSVAVQRLGGQGKDSIIRGFRRDLYWTILYIILPFAFFVMITEEINAIFCCVYGFRFTIGFATSYNECTSINYFKVLHQMYLFSVSLSLFSSQWYYERCRHEVGNQVYTMAGFVSSNITLQLSEGSQNSPFAVRRAATGFPNFWSEINEDFVLFMTLVRIEDYIYIILCLLSIIGRDLVL